MFVALAFAVAASGAGAPAPVQRDYSIAELAQIACIDTSMRRGALVETAQRHRWREARITSGGSSKPGWSEAYRVGQMTVVLSSAALAGSVDPAHADLCTITVQRPPSDWRPDVEAMVLELDLQREPDVVSMPGVQMQSWSKLGTFTLTAAYVPANQTLAITLSRQAITSTH